MKPVIFLPADTALSIDSSLTLSVTSVEKSAIADPSPRSPMLNEFISNSVGIPESILTIDLPAAVAL